MTGTLPRGAARSALAPILREHGLVFEPIDNAFVQAQLPPDDVYVRATKSWCDCGTPLGSSTRVRAGSARSEAHATRATQELRKKGWGPAKIERWLAQQERTRARDDRVRKSADAANAVYLETWRDGLTALARAAGHVGLVLHWYKGGLETERIELVRRQQVAVGSLDSALLGRIEEDVLYLFTP